MNRLIEILNCDSRYGIGKRNGLLFRQPKDMAFFKATTLGHTVVMGENTLLSFPNAKPLPGRTNIVLSQDPTHNYENVVNVHDFSEFLSQIRLALEKDDVYVIGGASIYRQLLPYCDEVLLTKIQADGGAEVFFVNIDEDPGFKLLSQTEPEEDNGRMIAFCRYANLKKMPL